MTAETSEDPRVDLHGTMDAAAWAGEFLRLFEGHVVVREGSQPVLVPIPAPVDEGTILGWFANAIMAGWDALERRQMERVESFEACPICGSRVVVRLPAAWADGRALAIVECGNPWHYAVVGLGDSPDVDRMMLALASVDARIIAAYPEESANLTNPKHEAERRSYAEALAAAYASATSTEGGS